jgi:hypothetical protein
MRNIKCTKTGNTLSEIKTVWYKSPGIKSNHILAGADPVLFIYLKHVKDKESGNPD